MIESKDGENVNSGGSGGGSRYAILFVLEDIGGSARQAMFDVLRSILGDQGVKLSPVHISRFCLNDSPDRFVEPLLGALKVSKLSTSKLVEDIKSGIAMQLSNQTASLPEPMAAVLDAARSAGIELAALSALPQAAAETLMETLGLNTRGVQLTVRDASQDDHFPRADQWLMLSKKMSKSPLDCGVVATCQSVLKSSISAGMRCVAAPDTFTMHQDFSGANAVYEHGEESDASDLISVLCPHLHED